jgi:hypothetical protein
LVETFLNFIHLGKPKNTRAADKNVGGNIFGEFFTISAVKALETNFGEKIRAT